MRNQVHKIAKFFDTELTEAMRILIVASPAGYELFGRFRIESKNTSFYVSDIRCGEKIELSSLKHAVAWCVLADGGKYHQSRRLHILDLKLNSLTIDSAIHRKMLKASITDSDRLLYKIKLQEDYYRKKLVLEEISTYINNSKTLHTVKMKPRKQPIFKYK
jgi:hypothetical protein